MSNSTNEEGVAKGTPWHILAFKIFFIIGALVYFWPSLIEPFRYFQFWPLKGSFWEAVKGAWPWYLWGVGVTLIFMPFSQSGYTFDTPMDKFISGTWKSVWAGVAEEMAFRWIFFFSGMVLLPAANYLLGGFMGFDLIRWLYQGILCPVANLFTFGYLEPYLLNGYDWAVGAAVISSNGRFRNGHWYQGPIGLVNAWFFGMYMHWVVFKYGILPAIFIHFFYDFLIFTLKAVGSSFTETYIPPRARRGCR